MCLGIGLLGDDHTGKQQIAQVVAAAGWDIVVHHGKSQRRLCIGLPHLGGRLYLCTLKQMHRAATRWRGTNPGCRSLSE